MRRLLVLPAEEILGNNRTVRGNLVLNFFDELRRRVPVP